MDKNKLLAELQAANVKIKELQEKLLTFEGMTFSESSKITELEQQIKTSQEQTKNYADEIQRQLRLKDQLEQQLKKAESVIEFYADTNNWDYDKTDAGKSKSTGNTCYDIMLFDFDRDLVNRSDYAGKLARQYLKSRGE